jgi:hypothetical protein
MVKAKWSRCMTKAESIDPTTLAEPSRVAKKIEQT